VGPALDLRVGAAVSTRPAPRIGRRQHTSAESLKRSSANASRTTMISLCTRVAASGIMLCAQNAISRPVSRVSPRPLLDRNHWRRSSTNETRQMGTFSAVAQSAVMRSNSWCRGVSSLRGALRLAARAPGGALCGTRAADSSRLRSVDMRSSSSSGRGQDIFSLPRCLLRYMLVWRRSAARFRSSAGWLGLLGVTAGPLEQSNPAQVENAVRETPSAIKLLTSLSLKASRRHCGGTEPPAMPPVQKVPRRSTMRREWDGGPRTSTFPVFQ
jgi:hypothetical protein